MFPVGDRRPPESPAPGFVEATRLTSSVNSGQDSAVSAKTGPFISVSPLADTSKLARHTPGRKVSYAPGAAPVPPMRPAIPCDPAGHRATRLMPEPLLPHELLELMTSGQGPIRPVGGGVPAPHAGRPWHPAGPPPNSSTVSVPPAIVHRGGDRFIWAAFGFFLGMMTAGLLLALVRTYL